MSDQARELSFAEVLASATESGTWIEGPFEGVVRNPRDGTGRQSNKADLHDPRDPSKKATVCAYGFSFNPLRGCLCRFGPGRGTKAKIYKGAIEITIGKEVPTTKLSEAEAAPPPGATGTPPARARETAPPPAATPAEAANRFHSFMMKTSLLLFHAHQYARDIESKLPKGAQVTEEQFQSWCTSLFLTAKEAGFLGFAPPPREVDEGGLPVRWTRLSDPETDAKKHAAEEEEKKRKAAEAERAAEDERKRKERERADEDVPF